MQHSVRYKADGSRLINVQTVQRDSQGRERLILTEGGGRKITQRSNSGFQKRKKNWTGKGGSIPGVWLGVQSSFCWGIFQTPTHSVQRAIQ